MEPSEQKRSKCPFEYCEVCRRNHDQGRRHRYFPTHCAAFSAALSRFSSKLSHLRLSLTNPAFLRPERAKACRLWCMFCAEEIIDSESVFSWGNSLAHLATEMHLKKVKEFLWKHGVGSTVTDRVDSFRVSESELAEWEKGCELLKKKKASPKDIHNEKITYNSIDNYVNNTNFNDSLNSNVMPLQIATNLESQDIRSNLAGSSFSYGAQINTVEKKANGKAPSILTNGNIKGIGSNEDSSNGIIGNVHTGAPPPWLESTELSLNPKNDKSLNQNFNSTKKPSKLNPKRVGAAWSERRRAEMARENNNNNSNNNDEFGDNWLPNFGRVWQSGTRKDSKKEFEKFAKGSGFNKRGSENIEMEVQIKPYTSKRLRVDLSKEE